MIGNHLILWKILFWFLFCLTILYHLIVFLTSLKLFPLQDQASSQVAAPPKIIMYVSENYLLLLTCLVLIHFIRTLSYAEQYCPKNSSCNPSACGNIHCITYPFRLKDDPEYCGHHNRSYEISCENNITASVYVDKYKYHVRAINYRNHTISLADPSIKKNDSCSFPTYSPNWLKLSSNFEKKFPSAYKVSNNRYLRKTLLQTGMVWPVIFLSCPDPLNDPLFTETNKCVSSSSNTSNRHRHTYIKFGDIDPRDLGDMCRIDLVVMTSLPLVYEAAKNDISLSKIHESLLYGFELSWSVALCECKAQESCFFYGTTAACIAGCSIFNGYQMFDLELLVRITTWRPFPHINGGPCFYPWYYETLIGLLIILVYSTVVYLALRILVGVPFLLSLIIYKLRRRHLSMFDVIEGFLQSHNNLMPIRYSYSNIKKMTRGFREKLGQGGYGSVYKGKLRSGNIVAVKVLNNPSANAQDFINEVATIGRIHHMNVVKLVGYCIERSKCALVYDFMPNGSLEKHIYSEKTEYSSLSWDRKYEIAVGVARGIEYLHQGCDIQILHFDIKPHNILLDDKFNPKISDFGLAKFYSTEKSTVTLTAARGTIGYVAPELINRSIGGVSYKADVYSFGMLLVEMVGLKKDLAANGDNSSQYFPHWIYDCLNEGKDIEIAKVDETDHECGRIITRMTTVALWCIQMSPDNRPSMSKVLKMLESDAELLQIPPHPSEFDEQVAQNKDQTWETYSTDSTALLCDGSSLGQDF